MKTTRERASNHPPCPGDASLAPQPDPTCDRAAKVSELCQLARQQGRVTDDDIYESLPEALMTPEGIEAIYAQLRDRGVQVVREAELKAEVKPTRGRPERLDDPVQMYLREVRRIRSLTRGEEIAIFQRIEAAEASIREVFHGLGLTASEQLALAEGWLSGSPKAELPRRHSLNYAQVCAQLEAQVAEIDRAKQEIVVAHLWLVVQIARRYSDSGLALLDLIQEGNLGLMKAVGRFDYRRGYRFSSWATWGIREAISRAVANQSRLIRIPVHVYARTRSLLSIQRQLGQELGHRAYARGNSRGHEPPRGEDSRRPPQPPASDLPRFARG